MVQTVDQVTRGVETLDLLWSNKPDLISNIRVTPYPKLTDHSVVIANTTYVFTQHVVDLEQNMVESLSAMSINLNKGSDSELEEPERAKKVVKILEGMV